MTALSRHLRILAAASQCVFLLLAGPDAIGQDGPRLELTGLPTGMIARLGARPLLHGAIVTHLRFAPDAKLLVTAGHENIVRVFSVPDGKLLGATEVGMRRVNPVTGLEIAPDGTHVVVANADESGFAQLHLLEIPSGKIVRKHKSINPGIVDITISADGKRAFFVESNGDSRTWELASGRVSDAKPHSVKAIQGRLSPGNRWLAAQETNGTEVQLFDLDANKKIPGAKTFHAGGTSSFPASFSPDGKSLAIAQADGKLAIVDCAAGMIDQTYGLPGDGAATVSCSPDGRHVAVGIGGKLSIFSLEAGKWLHSFERPNGIVATAFANDGQTIAVADAKNFVGLFSFHTGRRFDRQTGFVYSAVPSPDGETIYAQHDDHTVQAWDVLLGQTTTRMVRKASKFGIATARKEEFGGRMSVSRDGSLLASADLFNRGIDLWDLANGKYLREIPILPASRDQITPGILSRSGNLLAMIRKETIEVRKMPTGSALRSITPSAPALQEPGAWFAADLSSDDRHLAVMNSRRVVVHELDRGRQVRDWTLPALARGYPLAFSPGGQCLAAADADTIFLWEIGTGKERRRIPSKATSSLAFTRDGLGLIVGSETGGVRIVSLLTAAEMHRWQDVLSVRFVERSADGRRLLTVGAEGVVTLRTMPNLHDALRTDFRPLALEPLEPAELWARLADDDAGKAYVAWSSLLVRPEPALKILAENLKPALADLDRKAIKRLVEQLNAEDFSIREKATAALRNLGPAATPVLKEAQRADHSPETQKRLAIAIASATSPPPMSAQTARALELAEAIGTEPARALLRRLASGEPTSEQTRSAAAALRRLEAK